MPLSSLVLRTASSTVALTVESVAQRRRNTSSRVELLIDHSLSSPLPVVPAAASIHLNSSGTFFS